MLAQYPKYLGCPHSFPRPLTGSYGTCGMPVGKVKGRPEWARLQHVLVLMRARMSAGKVGLGHSSLGLDLGMSRAGLRCNSHTESQNGCKPVGPGHSVQMCYVHWLLQVTHQS